MHFAKGRSSPFGEVGYAAPLNDGKLTKSLVRAETSLKIRPRGHIQPFDFVTPYCTR